MVNGINNFVEGLARTQLSVNGFNQYSYDSRFNSIRRKNLVLYFKQMAGLKPRMLLVGEAPGYRGCRLTGVPFTSEFILLNGLEELGLFGHNRGYRKTGEVERLLKEASASMVWESLLKAGHIPLIWNAFPFHPFQNENEQSNRKPTKDEIIVGQEFLQELIQLFDIQVVVAVGNTAKSSLARMGIACEKVRHPSHGGKTDFIKGINAAIAALSR